MATEWRTATVAELVNEGVLEPPIDGNHGEIHPKVSDFVDHGIPFIMASDLVGGRVDTTHCSFISEQQARNLRKGFALPGDVLISHKATIGRTAIVGLLDAPFLLLTPQVTYYRVRDPLRLNNQYLRLYFDSPDFQRLFDAWSQKGSTRAYLGITAQLDLPIVLPPPDEQRAIAQILQPLYDKIELNQRMNETLEAMAWALFRSWFVDFDPVCTKAKGHEAMSPKRLWSVFPDSLHHTEIGEVPTDWALCGLDEIAQFLNGLALQRFPAGNGPAIPVIKIAQLRAGNSSGADMASAKIPQQYIVDDGDVLFSWSGSLECVLWAGGVGALNQHVFKVTSSNYPKWFYYLWIHRHLGEFRHIAESKATTMGHIQRHHLSAAKVVVPPRSVLDVLDQQFNPLINAIVTNKVQSRTLRQLRDVLLPQLISGQLRLENPDRCIGAAK